MDLIDMSATTLAEGIAARKIAPSEVMAAHLDRIAACNAS